MSDEYQTQTVGLRFTQPPLPLPLVLYVFNDPRQDREHDYREYHEREVLLHRRQPAEEVPREHERTYPQDPADDVVSDEFAIAHRADSCDERREGADDRHEPREDDRLAAVFLIEPVRLFQVLPLEYPAVCPLKDPRPHVVADSVVDGISQNRGDAETNEDVLYPQGPHRREVAYGEEERVAGENGSDHEPCLAEDYEEEYRVGVYAVVLDDDVQVAVQVQEYVYERLYEFHRFPFVTDNQDTTY